MKHNNMGFFSKIGGGFKSMGDAIAGGATTVGDGTASLFKGKNADAWDWVGDKLEHDSPIYSIYFDIKNKIDGGPTHKRPLENPETVELIRDGIVAGLVVVSSVVAYIFIA